MSPGSGSFSVAGLVVRILARCIAVLFILILVAFMIPEDGGSVFSGWSWDWRSLDIWRLVFPFGYLIGLILILWKDAWGGVVSVGCILAMYFRFALQGDSFSPVMAAGVIPGILAIFAWNISRNYVPKAPPRAPIHGGA